VRLGEIPSDAVLLATLLAPLPRGERGALPIPKAKPREEEPAKGEQPEEPEEGEEGEEGGDEPEAEDELEQAARQLEEVEKQEAATAPLPEGALRSDELHDERLGARGVPAFSLGEDKKIVPWSLPQGVASPEDVLTEM